MIKVNFNKSPALSLISVYEIDDDTPYLSSDNRFIIIKSDYDKYIVFDLEFNKEIKAYDETGFKDLAYDNPSILMLFPNGTTNIGFSITIG